MGFVPSTGRDRHQQLPRQQNPAAKPPTRKLFFSLPGAKDGLRAVGWPAVLYIHRRMVEDTANLSWGKYRVVYTRSKRKSLKRLMTQVK